MTDRFDAAVEEIRERVMEYAQGRLARSRHALATNTVSREDIPYTVAEIHFAVLAAVHPFLIGTYAAALIRAALLAGRDPAPAAGEPVDLTSAAAAHVRRTAELFERENIPATNPARWHYERCLMYTAVLRELSMWDTVPARPAQLIRDALALARDWPAVAPGAEG